MIFATVGTQLPFDRLLLSLDSWAAGRPDIPVLAQTGTSRLRFQNIATVGHVSQAEFRARMTEARVVVGHAGMGTILTAAELGKPLILMPRLARYGEHRNDHQLDTLREMARLSNVTVARSEEELHAQLDSALAGDFEADRRRDLVTAVATRPLLDFVREFVWKDRPVSGHADATTPRAAA
ncbi:glycosyltransferase [Histidinibacterium lentulum]|uniref:Glycosyl transferase family 28 C-terminal domain-containing protein n=1 Tax=Histidinibacterium lentulum TaxID=2480588 RepID=A0A3N2RA97_9RHOB|nr:glycosyltransferase [Histidinibacterium lentulum]ROU04337.1 hypothetical protein EAT49_02820 [Histidinibacterium lentulum]